MNTWNHLPNPHHHDGGFTQLHLHEDSIKPQLEQLGAANEVGLAQDLKLLREEALADPTRTNLRVRPDQKSFTEPQKEAFKNAVDSIVRNNSGYARLVLDHADMSHNMHGSMGTTGLLRFLGWHRQYLKVFEDLLIAADRNLRPSATDRIALPFWYWDDPFPDWLVGYLPSKHPGTGATVPSRRNTSPPEKPSANDVDLILNHFGNQLPTTNFPDADTADYVRFSYALEGWGVRPDGTSLPAHNHVHDWVGGIMSNTSYSPTDPIFWIHHAEVDRLWAAWQMSHPNAHPPLSGADRVFDPWTASYDTVKSVEAMGYTYEVP